MIKCLILDWPWKNHKQNTETNQIKEWIEMKTILKLYGRIPSCLKNELVKEGFYELQKERKSEWVKKKEWISKWEGS